MALYGNLFGDEEKNKQNQDQGQGFQLTSGIQGGAAGRTGTSNASNVISNKPLKSNVKKGSGFTNLGQYIAANQGEGQRMADVLKGSEEKLGQEAVDKIKTAQDEELKKLNEIKSFGFDLNLLNDPSKMTPEQKKAFSEAYNQDFDPSKQNLSDVFNLDAQQGNLNAFDTRKDLYNTNAGLNAVLGSKEGFGRENYTQGSRGLDAYLLGQSGAQKGIQDAIAAQKTGLQSQIESGAKNRSDKLSALDKEFDAAKNALQTGYQDILNKAKSDLSNQKFNFVGQDYKGPTEFTNINDLNTATSQLQALDAQNKKAFELAKANFLNSAKSKEARLNALLELTGGAAQTTDWNKFVGDYKNLMNNFTLSPMEKDKSQLNKIGDTLISGAKNLGTNVSNDLKTLKDYLIPATNPNPLQSIPAQIDLSKKLGQNAGTTTQNIIDTTKNIVQQTTPNVVTGTLNKAANWLDKFGNSSGNAPVNYGNGTINLPNRRNNKEQNYAE